MSRAWLGVAAPLFVSAVVWTAVWAAPISPGVARGVSTGIAIAVAQSLLSVGAMKWAWKTKWFYWTWGGGMLFRLAVFSVTAFIFYRGSQTDFVATMVSLVVATTVFLVFESMTIFGKR